MVVADQHRENVGLYIQPYWLFWTWSYHALWYFQNSPRGKGPTKKPHSRDGRVGWKSVSEFYFISTDISPLFIIFMFWACLFRLSILSTCLWIIVSPFSHWWMLMVIFSISDKNAIFLKCIDWYYVFLIYNYTWFIFISHFLLHFCPFLQIWCLSIQLQKVFFF